METLLAAAGAVLALSPPVALVTAQLHLAGKAGVQLGAVALPVDASSRVVTAVLAHLERERERGG